MYRFCLSLLFITIASTGWSNIEVTKLFEETSYYLKDICFVDSLVGVAVGETHWDQSTRSYRGTIIKTTDSGVTWTAQAEPVNKDLNSVVFVDSNIGWAVGDDGTIVHTSDGGTTWVQQSVATDDEFRGVFFLNSSLGWATSVRVTHLNFVGQPDNWESSIWHTSNGGQTWTEQTVPSDTSILKQITFVDADRGWTVGVRYIGDDPWPEHRATIYNTTDGGQTWNEQYAPDLEISLTGVDFLDATYGWAVGFKTRSSLAGGSTFRTTDGGASWQRLDPSGLLQDVKFIDQNRGYMVGCDYIGAWGPPVYRTLDGGVTWDKIRMDRHDSDGIFGVVVLTDRVFAVGDHDYVTWSDDPWGTIDPFGEDLFTHRYLNIHYKLEDICFVDESHGWAVGSRTFAPSMWGQVILNTDDGGASWDIQFEAAPRMDWASSYFRLDSVHFTDLLNGWAVGIPWWLEGVADFEKHNTILHTTDGGQTWQEQGEELEAALSHEQEFVDVFFLDNQEAWALSDPVFDNPFVAHTTDGGSNWSWVYTGFEGDVNIMIGFGIVQGGVFFSDANHGWIVGGLGDSLRTTDGGATWELQHIGVSPNLYDVFFQSQTHGFIAAERGLYETTNGGVSWLKHDLNVVYLFDIKATSTGALWTVGTGGSVYTSEDNGVNWSPVTTPTGATLRGLSFPTARRGFFAGDYGTILGVRVTEPPLFADDFESGNLSAWSGRISD